MAHSVTCRDRLDVAQCYQELAYIILVKDNLNKKLSNLLKKENPDICQKCGCVMNQEEFYWNTFHCFIGQSKERQGSPDDGRVSPDDSAKSLGTPGKEILSKMWTKGA